LRVKQVNKKIDQFINRAKFVNQFF